MAPSSKKVAQSTPAKIVLIKLENCLVNLPSALVSALATSDSPAQNVAVELIDCQPPPSSNGQQPPNESRSIYVGWTGMSSRSIVDRIISRDGTNGFRGGGFRKDQTIASVEIDRTFARTLGLNEGHIVDVVLHLHPVLAQTVHIEPLTTDDWEIIELHATFLELNLLSQIRILPNPTSHQKKYPLTIHLSPTATANFTISSLIPTLPSTTAFARIAPDAEVIVAPKMRTRPPQSVGSMTKRSIAGRTATNAARHRGQREESSGRGTSYFRGVDRGVDSVVFEGAETMQNSGLKVWVNEDALSTRALRGIQWVSVSIIKPSALQLNQNSHQADVRGQDQVGAVPAVRTPATRVVASIATWVNAPDGKHVAMSSALCLSLGSAGMVGCIVRIEAAPSQMPRSSVKSLGVYPFTSTVRGAREGLKFGGESQADRDHVAHLVKRIYGGGMGQSGTILDGPLCDGLILGTSERDSGTGTGWGGGLLRFEPEKEAGLHDKNLPSWILGADVKLGIEVRAEIPPPKEFLASPGPGQSLYLERPVMVGIDPLITKLVSHLSQPSSTLLIGGMGSGKTSLAQLIGHELRFQSLYNVTYFPCRTLIPDETRISTIKATLESLFLAASWSARLGGRSLVILDDLDKLCPSEATLQVGGENERSRQISELLCSIVRHHCGESTGVVWLATTQSKESLNSVIVGGHVVRETVVLRAPDKECRRQVLEQLILPKSRPVRSESDNPACIGESYASTPPLTGNGGAWMDTSSSSDRVEMANEKNGFSLDEDFEVLDLAGKTDGFMPGDLVLLVARARSEALIHSVRLSSSPSSPEPGIIKLGKDDFTRAMKGFTPASLRNVTLQSSTTTFESIGGLRETRQILLETLQYPTKYAPIFAQCPLRLRSGLLLYGYPGCGKTLLASAVAGECGLNFISVKGPEILNKYIGASEKSVRDLFERAESARPCVLFFDEFDSIAPKRGHDSTGVTDRVVNQLLTQMDGAEGLSGVYVLAATSRPDLIDPALLRPGRLDKSLLCDLPSCDDRSDILRALSKKLKLGSDVLEQGLKEVAQRTEGYSGADLQALIYNAQLAAIQDILSEQSHGFNGSLKTEKTNRIDATHPTPTFLSFPFGEEEHRAEIEAQKKTGSNRESSSAERATITAKLASIKLARRKHRQLRRGSVEDPVTQRHGDGPEQSSDQEVVIQWKHIMSSLSTSRASISADERRRLNGFYREFAVGRNGEMPSGEGSTEVGGRSSLM